MGRQLVPSTTIWNFKFIVNARAMSSFKILLLFMVVATVMLIQTEKAEAQQPRCTCAVTRNSCRPVQPQSRGACPNGQVCTCGNNNLNIRCSLRARCRPIGG